MCSSDLVDYESYSRFDASVFDFEVPAAHGTDPHAPDRTPPSTKE